MNLVTSGTTTTTNEILPYVRKTELTKRKKEIILPTFTTSTINQSFNKAKDSITNKKQIFGDLITVGDLTILFGRSNVGKSFLAFQMAEAIASGKNVLDIMSIDNQSTTAQYNLKNETHAQPLIYFDFEATIEKNFNRYRAKGQNYPYLFSENLYVSYPDKLSFSDPSLFIDAMADETKKTGAKVIIIDNLSAISQDNEKSGNAAKLMSRIRDYQRENNLTVIILAHTPKVYENQPITENNLAGSANIFNLSDAVIAINTTTLGSGIRYIKQIKSKYNEKYFEEENVITINFSADNPNGFKGFDFLAYENEIELIKIVEKNIKDDENEEIINEIIHFNSSYMEIAKKLHPKYGKGVDIKTYRERIIKRSKTLRTKGLIPDNSEASQLLKPATSQQLKPISQLIKPATSEASQLLMPISQPTTSQQLKPATSEASQLQAKPAKTYISEAEERENEILYLEFQQELNNLNMSNNAAI